MTLERIVKLLPAWDKRNSDPSKNYGVHGVELRMVLKGPEGAVQFVLYTNWHLPHVTEGLLASGHSEEARERQRSLTIETFGFGPGPRVDFDGLVDRAFKMYGTESTTRQSRFDVTQVRALFQPIPTDLGYHSRVPRYDDHKVIDQACPYLDGRPCYYDGSGLNAYRIYNVLLEEGSYGVWRALEAYYKQVFDGDSR